MDDVGNDDVGAMYSARTVVSDCKWGDGGKGGVGNGGRIATSLAQEYTPCYATKLRDLDMKICWLSMHRYFISA